MSSIKEFEHLSISLEAIKSATNNFDGSNYIGRGGFGKVYKGELSHHEGRSMVAVKRLDRAFGQGDPEFLKEIMMLSRYRHQNLVCLLGFCDERGERLLVYEHAPCGSLDHYLSSPDLTWIQRLKICVGAARGLEHLHNPNGTQHRVLHRDIKSSNILLDKNWEAKISDFGLSKIGPANQPYTFIVSNVIGTFGYVDPLYMETCVLTKESDVYSFGVVLFEVLCGRLCISNHGDESMPLTGLARQSYENNRLDKIIFNKLKLQIDPDSLKKFTTVAYQCLKRDREERPTMTQIVKELEIALESQSCKIYDHQEHHEIKSKFDKSGVAPAKNMMKKSRGQMRSATEEDLDGGWAETVRKVGIVSFGAEGNGKKDVERRWTETMRKVGIVPVGAEDDGKEDVERRWSETMKEVAILYRKDEVRQRWVEAVRKVKVGGVPLGAKDDGKEGVERRWPKKVGRAGKDDKADNFINKFRRKMVLQPHGFLAKSKEMVDRGIFWISN